jgi:hypothetical protein
MVLAAASSLAGCLHARPAPQWPLVRAPYALSLRDPSCAIANAILFNTDAGDEYPAYTDAHMPERHLMVCMGMRLAAVPLKVAHMLMVFIAPVTMRMALRINEHGDAGQQSRPP